MIKTLFLGLILLLPACGGVKDALTLKKKSSADEFLVEKKSPLVIPPEFGKLPKPTTNQNDNLEENEIEKLLTNKNNKILSSENNAQSSSLEESILKNIK